MYTYLFSHPHSPLQSHAVPLPSRLRPRMQQLSKDRSLLTMRRVNIHSVRGQALQEEKENKARKQREAITSRISGHDAQLIIVLLRHYNNIIFASRLTDRARRGRGGLHRCRWRWGRGGRRRWGSSWCILEGSQHLHVEIGSRLRCACVLMGARTIDMACAMLIIKTTYPS